ncbi:MAG: flagellar type III secretion system protein FliR [Deltaproteobacteria bacterium]|nr:flagellar type III secretion system protein FliR [Deltaproteobacteria bacterium]
MNPLDLSFGQFQYFVLILVRVSAIIMTLPVLGSRNVPVMVKAGFALLTSILVFPTVRTSGVIVPQENLTLILAILREIGIGLLIGYLARLLFAGFQVAGQMIGYQMGFAIVSVFDPQSSSQLSIMAYFENLLALLLFLSLNLHHVLLRGLAESFQLIPLLGAHYPLAIMQQLVRNTGDLFVLAVKIGAPVMAALLFTNVAMGLIARTVPQMNIFIVSFPFQIGCGLIVLGLSLPLTVKIFEHSFVTLEQNLQHLFRMIRMGT